MTAKELQLDYFHFYDVANQQAGQVIGLQGQFDKQPEKVQLTYLNLFASPASKNGEPIYDNNAHLTWYDLYDPVPEPMRIVALENQFGQQKIMIGRTYALLSPTQVAEPGSSFPENLDHYKLYQVLDGEPVNKAVKLKDHFWSGETKVYHPIFFGVPVRKWYEGQTYGVHNEKAHLVIYRIYPNATDKTVLTRDQFGRRYLQLFRGILLGAPSVKLKWQEA